MPVTGEITPSQFESFIKAIFSKDQLKQEMALKIFDVDVTNEHGESALIITCRSRIESIVRFLVEHGANVNHRAHDGTTPLYVSIK